MKRSLILLCTAIILSLTLAACGDGEVTAPTAAPTETVTEVTTSAPTAAPTAAPAEDVTALIETSEILTGSHDREEGYQAAFGTRMLELPGLSVHMENRIFDEAELRRYAALLVSDIDTAERASGIAGAELSVYLVRETVEGVPAAVENRLFCSPSDIESGEYRPALMGAAYGLASEWQRVGLAELVFNESADDAALREYYAAGGHDMTASCSALHLSTFLADAETADAARKTSRSLAEFVINRDGFEAFRASGCAVSLLPDWAEALGLAAAPSLPEGSERITDMRVVPREHFSGIVYFENFTIYAAEDGFIRTPDELYSFLCGLISGMDGVLAKIEAEAPAFADIARERYGEPVAIFLFNGETPTYAYPYQNRIDLGRSDAIWREMVHLLLEPNTDNERLAWICEGLAEHFSFEAATEYCHETYESEGYEAYLEFFEDVSSLPASADDLIFHQKVWELYQALRSPEAEEYDDQGAYSRAFAACSLLFRDRLERTQFRSVYDGSVASKRGMSEGTKQTDGNAMSYPEAELLLGYLFERFGADNVIDSYFKGLSLETAFGMSYKELFTGFTAKLAEKYAWLLVE